ncbi:MAG TPA: DUF2065 domain-containing protein [Gammaproteobacteria bacterium]|nr:DUF2065 domain-containing protein [Gammaproteobacteria bacterium]
MMSSYLLTAIGLVFILEGLLPFLLPRVWRRAMQQMVMQNDSALRIFGFVSMLIGLSVLYFVR